MEINKEEQDMIDKILSNEPEFNEYKTMVTFNSKEGESPIWCIKIPFDNYLSILSKYGQ